MSLFMLTFNLLLEQKFWQSFNRLLNCIVNNVGNWVQKMDKVKEDWPFTEDKFARYHIPASAVNQHSTHWYWQAHVPTRPRCFEQQWNIYHILNCFTAQFWMKTRQQATSKLRQLVDTIVRSRSTNPHITA